MKIYNILAFNEFYNTISNRNMPITLAYQLNSIIKSLDNDLEFYQTELTKILNDCVEKDQNGQFKMSEDQQNYLLKQEMTEEFKRRFNELQNIEVNTIITPLNISSLSLLEITPRELAQIQDFIK